MYFIIVLIEEWLVLVLNISFNHHVFFLHIILSETPPPGYISEDGETSDQQMNQSMDTGTLY